MYSTSLFENEISTIAYNIKVNQKLSNSKRSENYGKRETQYLSHMNEKKE